MIELLIVLLVIAWLGGMLALLFGSLFNWLLILAIILLIWRAIRGE